MTCNLGYFMGCSKDLARKDTEDTDTHSIQHTMGWLRLVGSLKLQVSFAEYRLFYRALLQKRPLLLRSLLIVATPCLYGIVSEEDLSHCMCLTHDWLTSHMRVSHVTYMIEMTSRHISQFVNWSMSHISRAWMKSCARVTWRLWIASCHVTWYESDQITRILYVN